MDETASVRLEATIDDIAHLCVIGTADVLQHADRNERIELAADVAEIVEDGHTGLLVPPNDPSALIDAIVSLLTHPERARGFGEAARRRSCESFGIDLQIEHTLALWSELLGRAGQ